MRIYVGNFRFYEVKLIVFPAILVMSMTKNFQPASSMHGDACASVTLNKKRRV